MSDPTRPTSGSEYADAVRDVMVRAAESEAARAAAVVVPERKSLVTRPPVVVALSFMFLSVLVWNVTLWRRTPASLTPQETEVVLDLSVVAASQAVEEYRREHGTLPPDLQVLGFPETLRLVPQGDGYTIVAREGGMNARLDSDDGPVPFLLEAGAAAALLSETR